MLLNAVKDIPAGGPVNVTAGLDDTGEEIRWTLIDTGIGVPATARPYIFRRFYRPSIATGHPSDPAAQDLAGDQTLVHARCGAAPAVRYRPLFAARP